MVMGIHGLLNAYANLVRKYPSVFSSVEETAKSLTLLMPDRFGSAELRIEAIYAMLNLLGLYHSKILMKPPNNPMLMLYVTPPPRQTAHNIRMFKMASHANTMLAMIGDVQVLLEMIARQSGIRWPVILTIELLKCLCRLAVMRNNSSESTMLRIANTSELNREILEGRLLSGNNNNNNHDSCYASNDNNNGNSRNLKNSLELSGNSALANDFSELVELYKISGRGQSRHGNFSNIYFQSKNNFPSNNDSAKTALSPESSDNATSSSAGVMPTSFWSLERINELLHIARPVVYVLAILKYGYNSWIPFTVSLVLDLVSLFKSIQVNGGPAAALKLPEINRRVLLLLAYLIRPPLFTKFTRIPIIKIFSILEKLPFVGVIFSNILQLVLSLQSHFYYVNQC
eukprot:TRINITY_DN5984_c0_g2_i1.p1 TRINITY_DN5984_c0_g2~~TRINITY_DN5984_c0_g2_i1.p1  ORF type:complete len:400 (-),score=111.49 TRINITY_DN5984_c0_g2_i1:93-1292(-)